MELIDRTSLVDAMKNHPEYYDGQDAANWMQKCIYAAPTVDAVEVIRCKDCTRLETRGFLQWCKLHNILALPDGFCANALRNEHANRGESDEPHT